ncbi:MAG: C10 family peptidase [Planctomycetota bacterium]
MRSVTNTILATSIVLLAAPLCVQAELTSEQEALTIARNYVSFILTNEGNWSGSEVAAVASIEEFKRGDRTLGYFCAVQPQGYLVLSLHKELAPVKAYSSRCDLDPEAVEGLTDLIKDKMERILDAVEKQLGRPLAPDDQIGDLLAINYRAISDELVSEDFEPQAYGEPRNARGGAGMDYQEGETLLPCNWHQQPPYNQQCPDLGCGEWAGYNNFNTNARVGCVAVVGAHLMRHWNWPPSGEGPFSDSYDWANMCAEYIFDGTSWFNDENGVPVTWDQINAAAELCDEVGVAVGMDYGCDGSSATTSDLLAVFDDYFHYNEGQVKYRAMYEDPVDWFNLLKNSFNANRPVPYRVEEHAIIGDGWQEVWDQGHYHWYHMNYGWPSNGHDTWWALDALYLGGIGAEYIIINVFPDNAIGTTVWLNYPAAVRYFDRDASGSFASFDAGNGLQVLKSGFLLTNTGGASDVITLYGTPTAKTRFFLEGDLAGKTRISIQGGAMKINGGGEMVIR